MLAFIRSTLQCKGGKPLALLAVFIAEELGMFPMQLIRKKKQAAFSRKGKLHIALSHVFFNFIILNST